MKKLALLCAVTMCAQGAFAQGALDQLKEKAGNEAVETVTASAPQAKPVLVSAQTKQKETMLDGSKFPIPIDIQGEMANGMSVYDILTQIDQEGVQPEISDLVGQFEGSCFDSKTPNTAEESSFTGKPVGEGTTGPLFGNKKNLMDGVIFSDGLVDQRIKSRGDSAEMTATTLNSAQFHLGNGDCDGGTNRCAYSISFRKVGPYVVATKRWDFSEIDPNLSILTIIVWKSIESWTKNCIYFKK